ncbi:LytTr DNA-binding domain protein [compost metagenome]
MPDRRGLDCGFSGRFTPRAAFQTVSSLSHQQNHPGDPGSPVERYSYWIGLTLLMWLQDLATFWALRRADPMRALPIWLQAALAALVGAVPTTFEVAYVEGLLRIGGVLTPTSLLETFWSVAVVSLAVFVPLVVLGDARQSGAATAPELARRLPPELGAAVIALSAEDHYLRVYTERGDALIHYRFSDAVRALGAAGVQVHRSWWVAKNAVERIEREASRHVLVLIGGVRVPVSRTYGLAARQAGLIPDRE